MHFNARLVSFLLALSVAVVTTAFISLVKDAHWVVLFVAFAISFSSAFILFYFALELLVLSEINEAYSVLAKMKKKDFKLIQKRQNSTLSPIKKLNQEIYAYASKKQQEIDYLKQLAAYRREFLADVSHELKTPIFAAQGFIHTLLDGAVDDVDVRDKFLNKAAKSLDGLNVLVQDLFTLSQMEAGMIKMNFRVFDLAQLSREVFEQLEQEAQKKDIQLHFHATSLEKALIEADPAHIKRVMINLIENAIKYGKSGGQVWLALHETEKNIVVKVEDDGIGIPEEHLDRIFERFYRVEKSRTKTKGGSGLGLAIVKHILEAHDSKISVSSEVNTGTTFKFKLRKAANFIIAAEPVQDSNYL
ncbi:MAG: ATP-binding protein [Microscillaceae bacterium]|jgi:two-component system phosphate regulon sensor histidine kinase PhoR|nr:ATP-binding protein [Microscillaceae bacterium]